MIQKHIHGNCLQTQKFYSKNLILQGSMKDERLFKYQVGVQQTGNKNSSAVWMSAHVGLFVQGLILTRATTLSGGIRSSNTGGIPTKLRHWVDSLLAYHIKSTCDACIIVPGDATTLTEIQKCSCMRCLCSTVLQKNHSHSKIFLLVISEIPIMSWPIDT